MPAYRYLNSWFQPELQSKILKEIRKIWRISSAKCPICKNNPLLAKVFKIFRHFYRFRKIEKKNCHSENIFAKC
jgi:hypothetical protein